MAKSMFWQAFFPVIEILSCHYNTCNQSAHSLSWHTHKRTDSDAHTQSKLLLAQYDSSFIVQRYNSSLKQCDAHSLLDFTGDLQWTSSESAIFYGTLFPFFLKGSAKISQSSHGSKAQTVLTFTYSSGKLAGKLHTLVMIVVQHWGYKCYHFLNPSGKPKDGGMWGWAANDKCFGLRCQRESC